MYVLGSVRRLGLPFQVLWDLDLEGKFARREPALPFRGRTCVAIITLAILTII